MKKIILNEKEYEVVENEKDCLNETELQEKATEYFDDFDYSDTSKNVYLIFGKESTGIPKSILRPNIDRCMRIPMTDNVRALNLSNCVAIVIYEALRQQDYNDLLRDEPHKGKDFLERED